ncbi:MAG: hypothetical protein BAJATHORv1_10001 [Candidatus Thorarchaeota archaeon]|nr:MAG: hypothetical protein BAJATHORv1_10001 [Candidatus Thorarchaeota archaeon]
MLIVQQSANTPWGTNSELTITIRDLDDADNKINEGNLTSITIGSQIFTSTEWIFDDSGLYTQLTITYVSNNLAVGTHSGISTSLSVGSAYTNTASTLDLTISSHRLQISAFTSTDTPWSWTTNITVSLTDLDNLGNTVSENNVTGIIIDGIIFTSSNWTYSSGSFIMTLNTTDWTIGSGTYSVSVTTNDSVQKFYSDGSTNVVIEIASHDLLVDVTRPQATPWSDNTTIAIQLGDANNASLVISSDNITQIVIDGQIFTSWTYSNGQFTVEVDTDDWSIGSYSITIEIYTSGSGVTKFYLDNTGGTTIQIRERYSEAYIPAPDSVPKGDNLTFYVEFTDRDASTLVDLDTIQLNGTDLTQGIDFWVYQEGTGYYRVLLKTTSVPIGNREVTVTCSLANYEDASVVLRYRVRLTDTDAVASGYRFDVPVGTNVSFTITYTDVDHNIGLSGAGVAVNGSFAWSYTESNGVYSIDLETLDSTILGEYKLRFNFTLSGYEDAYVIIVLTVKTHSTYLSYDEPPVDTGMGDNITIGFFYEDVSLNIGISNDTGAISVTVTNSSGTVIFYVEDNTALGTGHYYVLIPADQFGGVGTYSFTTFFNWTDGEKYSNLTKSFSVDITGTATDLSIEVAPQSVYYGDMINFTLFYSTELGTGIENNTGNVLAYAIVTTGGQSISQSDFVITNLTGGYYQFVLDSDLFTAAGQYNVRTYLNWTPTASPYNENQTLSLTITILVRTTLIDLVPPQNTAFDENATFTFYYRDTSNDSIVIENSSQLSVTLTNAGIIYWLEYDSGTAEWTVTVDTSSVGDLGTVYLQLEVTWAGAPFFQNQTKSVKLEVTARPTQLTYSPPTPTYFNSNTTIQFSYYDLIDDSTSNMNGSTLVITSSGLDLTGNYTVIDNGDGTYTIYLNTTAFLEPNTFQIVAEITYTGTRYEANATVSFSLKVLPRAILATADPVGNTAWEADVTITLHLVDGETADEIGNYSGGVRINLASYNASSTEIQGLSIKWTTGTDTYVVDITNTLSIGTYVIYLNVSYDNIAPYYNYRVVEVTFSIRKHSTELQLSDPAASVGYGLNSTFELTYFDLDTSDLVSNAVLSITNTSLAGYWDIVPGGDGTYQIRINTTVFGGFGTFWVEVETQNSGSLVNYADTTIMVRVYVRERYTSLTYDPVATVGYTDNVTITLYYTATDSDTGITNSSNSLFIWVNQTTYYLTDGVEDGSYVIEIPANLFIAFQATYVRINTTYYGEPYYQNQSIVIQFSVRGTSTEFSWNPSDPVPYADIANITVYYGDSDSNIPVGGALGVDIDVSVICETQPSLDTSNTDILQVFQGDNTSRYATFFIIINTSYLDSTQTYSFRVTIDWINPAQEPYYQDQNDKLISLTVRSRDTAVPQIRADAIPYGETATVLLEYVDLDAEGSLVPNASLVISVLDGVSYSVDYTPTGDGFYTIYIETAGTGLVGTTQFNLTVTWNGVPFYENQTNVVVFITVNFRTPIMEIDYPQSTPYLDNVTFSIYLQDSHSLNYINNNESFFTATFVSPSIASQPVITFIGSGEYTITFDTEEIGLVGSWIMEITFDHSGNDPYYSLISRNISGTIRERATNLDYDPASATPYGEYIIFNMTFTDVDSNSPISTGQVYLEGIGTSEVLENGVNYDYQYLSNGIYLVNVSSIALGVPDSYSVIVTMNSTADWYLAERIRTLTLKVSYRPVELSTSAPDTTYYGDVTFFTMTLIDIGDESGLDGMQSYFTITFTTPSGLSNSSISIVDIGNGEYNVSFDTDILNELVNYKVSIVFNAPYTPSYWASTSPKLVTGRVSTRPTQLSYDVTSTTPYLNNVTISLEFIDANTAVGIAGTTMIATCSGAATPLVANTNYWISEGSTGEYMLLIDSTALGNIGDFSITVSSEYYGVPFYQNRTVSITVQVRERATRLTYTPPAEVPYGNNLTITLKYYDVDAGLLAIEDAASQIALETINGTLVDSSYYIVEWISSSTYYMYINTSKLAIYGHYELVITSTGDIASHYDDQTISLEADVRARNTQLTAAPIGQVSYTENATVTLYYTDKDANSGVSNITYGIDVTLNASIMWWIEEVTPGTFKLRINATDLGATGTFDYEVTFTWINGVPFYENRTLVFTITVTDSEAMLSYIPSPHVPIGDNITIILDYSDSATGDLISNNTYGVIEITITSLNTTPQGPFQYWIEETASGYVVTINSTPFWTTGNLVFVVDIDWTGGLPYYPDILGTEISSVVRGIYTQGFADAPDPGTVPIGDSTLVNVTYYDLDHDDVITGASISSDWPYGWTYEMLPNGKFNVTLHTAGVSVTGKLTVTFTFNRTFYQTKSIAVYITIRLISTSSVASVPEPSIVPAGDNVTLEVTFTDNDHQVNITTGSITTNWAYGWTWERVPNGGFIVTLMTENITNLIKYTVTFTLTNDSCLSAESSTKFQVRRIQTSINADVPPTLVAGQNVTVTITVTDLDHTTGVEDATILTTAPDGTYQIVEIGGGDYEIEFYLWDEGYGTFTYDVSVTKSNFEFASTTIDMDLRQVRTDISTPTTTLVLNWSTSFELSINYENLDVGGLVEEANVTAELAGVTYTLTSNTTYYNIIIDTSAVRVGTYIITVNANKTNYESRILQVTLVLSVLETDFISTDGFYSYSIVSGELVNLTVYYSTIAFGTGIDTATITYNWDYGSGVLTTTGAPGYYSTIVNSTGAEINTYTLYVRANKTNHAEASIYFSIEVGLVETDLAPLTSVTVSVVYGETADIVANFTNLNLEEPVIGATLTFKFADADYNGSLVETSDGIYSTTVDSSNLYAGSFTIYVIGIKPGYETGLLIMYLEVSKIDTTVSPLNASLTVFYQQSATFYVNYTDMHNNLQVENATVEFRWFGGTGTLEEIGNGIYRATFDSFEVGPGVFNIHISAIKDNYYARTTSVTLEVKEISTEMVVEDVYYIPVGDTVTISVMFNDTTYGRPIIDGIGVAVWIFGNPALNVTGNGNYTFTVAGNIAIDSYDVTFILSKVNHTTATARVTVVVREIQTSLETLTGTDFVRGTVGERIEFTVVYMDTDHNLPITGATLTIIESEDVIGEDQYSVVEGAEPGQYIIAFTIQTEGEFDIVLKAELGDNYDDQEMQLTVIVQQVAGDPLVTSMTYGFGIGMFILLIGAVYYFRVYSVPKMVRWLNKMIKSVGKGKIPEAAPVRGRDEVLQEIVNTELAVMGVSKPIDEIPAHTIDLKIPELDALLEELAEITGLSDEDVEVFRQDLFTMKPSERPGFVMEVIKQERARRAKDLEEKEKGVPEEDQVEATPEDLEDMRTRLKSLGLADDDIDVMVEQAKGLSKAEMEAIISEIEKQLG